MGTEEGGLNHDEHLHHLPTDGRTDAVKGYATEKIAKLQKFLRQPLHGQVTLSCQKTLHMAEVDMHAGADHYHAHETSEDMYASIDKVIDKLERQIRETHGAHKKVRSVLRIVFCRTSRRTTERSSIEQPAELAAVSPPPCVSRTYSRRSASA